VCGRPFAGIGASWPRLPSCQTNQHQRDLGRRSRLPTYRAQNTAGTRGIAGNASGDRTDWHCEGRRLTGRALSFSQILVRLPGRRHVGRSGQQPAKEPPSEAPCSNHDHANSHEQQGDEPR
jgi:hypothetical protein